MQDSGCGQPGHIKDKPQWQSSDIGMGARTDTHDRLTMGFEIAIWAAPTGTDSAVTSRGGEGMPKSIHCSRMLHASLALDAHLRASASLRAANMAGCKETYMSIERHWGPTAVLPVHF